MYLRGSKWNMAHRSRRRSNPGCIVVLLIFIAGAIYLNQIVVPKVPQLFIPTPTPTRSPESFVNEGEQFFSEGKLLPAIEAYRQAILVDPQNKANYVNMARMQIYAGQYAEALESSERALVGSENYSMAHAMRGWALNFLEDYAEAVIAVSKAIDLDPNNALAHAFYAEILVNRNEFGDTEKAILESNKAMTLAPNLFEVMRARGYVLYWTGNYTESLEKYQAAINLNKFIADPYLYMGYNYLGLVDKDPENTTKAINMFLQAKALNPIDPIPDLELSRTFARVGEYEKAVQYAENAVKNDPENPLRYGNLGMMYYENRQYDKAAQALGLCVRGGITPEGVAVKGKEYEPGWMTIYYWYYGFALAKVTPNRCSEAIPVFQALLTLASEDSIAVENANVGLELCKQAINTSSPGGEATPTP